MTRLSRRTAPWRFCVALCAAAALAACASGPEARIANQLMALGFAPKRADCVAGELGERLDNRSLNNVARALDGLNDAGSPGDVLQALGALDDASAARAVGGAAFACAL